MTPQDKWQKEKSGRVVAKYKKEFVQQFKAACKGLGVTQSEVIRNAMQETIERYEKNR